MGSIAVHTLIIRVASLGAWHSGTAVVDSPSLSALGPFRIQLTRSSLTRLSGLVIDMIIIFHYI